VARLFFVVLAVLLSGCAAASLSGRVHRVEAEVEKALVAYEGDGDALTAIHHVEDALHAVDRLPPQPAVTRMRKQLLEAKLALLLEAGQFEAARAVRAELTRRSI
jgi:hypothetical protein